VQDLLEMLFQINNFISYIIFVYNDSDPDKAIYIFKFCWIRMDLLHERLLTCFRVECLCH